VTKDGKSIPGNGEKSGYDLSLSILNEEIEHESWFSEFLGEGPSGQFLRRGETSPFVSKFLR
jgi:ferritin-like protein